MYVYMVGLCGLWWMNKMEEGGRMREGGSDGGWEREGGREGGIKRE